MTSDNRARLRVAALIFTMVNAVVFGVGLVTVLTTPAPLSWLISPMMKQRFIQSRHTR